MRCESMIREQICLSAKSLYDRGLAHGSTGNLSVRLEDCSLLITPTSSSFGFLDPAELSLVDSSGIHRGGLKQTKELKAAARLAIETAGSEVRALSPKQFASLSGIFKS